MKMSSGHLQILKRIEITSGVPDLMLNTAKHTLVYLPLWTILRQNAYTMVVMGDSKIEGVNMTQRGLYLPLKIYIRTTYEKEIE